MTVALTQLERLESESIHIMREVVAENEVAKLMTDAGLIENWSG
jgi:hypothetical protein